MRQYNCALYSQTALNPLSMHYILLNFSNLALNQCVISNNVFLLKKQNSDRNKEDEVSCIYKMLTVHLSTIKYAYYLFLLVINYC